MNCVVICFESPKIPWMSKSDDLHVSRPRMEETRQNKWAAIQSIGVILPQILPLTWQLVALRRRRFRAWGSPDSVFEKDSITSWSSKSFVVSCWARKHTFPSSHSSVTLLLGSLPHYGNLPLILKQTQIEYCYYLRKYGWIAICLPYAVIIAHVLDRSISHVR